MTDQDKERLKRCPFWLEQPERFEAVLRILYGYDPVGVCFPDNPRRSTEYAPEVNTILPRLKEAAAVADMRRVVYEEFVRWFDASAKNIERYDWIAADIWELLVSSSQTA